MNYKWLSVAGALALLLGLSGCATTYPPPSGEFAKPAPRDYLIGPGDNVNVMV